MPYEQNYKIKISNLDKRLDGTQKMIKDAGRFYLQLLQNNIRPFTKSGNLLNNWKIEIYNDKEASIYSNVPYARIRDQGGKIPITNKMRSFAWAKWYETKNEMWRNIAITKEKYIIQEGSNYSIVNLNVIETLLENKYPVV